MKVITDCNVLISAGMTDGTCRKVLEEIFTHHTILLSKEILFEYIKVISRKKLDKHRNYLHYLLTQICEVSDWIDPISSSISSSDPKDQIYVDVASSAQADYIITGNLKDFPIIVETTEVVSPKEFLMLQEYKARRPLSYSFHES